MTALLIIIGCIIVAVLAGLVVTVLRRRKQTQALQAFALANGGRWHSGNAPTRPAFGVAPGESYRSALEFGWNGSPVVVIQEVHTSTDSNTVSYIVRVPAPQTPKLCLYKIGPVTKPDSPLHKVMLRAILPSGDHTLTQIPVPDPTLRDLIAVFAADPRFGAAVLTPAFLHWFSETAPPLGPGIVVEHGLASVRKTGAMTPESVTKAADLLQGTVRGLPVGGR